MRRLLQVLPVGVLGLTLLAPGALASTPSNTTFADVIASSRLVVLAGIVHRPGGGITLQVERFLKGVAPAQLAFVPLAATPPFDGWSRAVIAFANPATDDFRAPTIAWHVASDGAIDPEHFQRYRGLPLTLTAMLRYFDSPPTDSAPVPGPTKTPDDAPLLVVFVAAAGLLFGLHRFRGPHRVSSAHTD